MTFEEFQTQVASRRRMTGEGYTVAAKALLEYLRSTGRITESEYYDFKRKVENGEH